MNVEVTNDPNVLGQAPTGQQESNAAVAENQGVA
jgi:hypothetical protein